MTFQYLRPDADSIDGGWTNESGGTTLFSSIDESSPNDSDYVASSQLPSNDLVKFRLSDPTGGSTIIAPSTVYYRFKAGGSGDPINLTVSLLQGSTTIATWTHTGVSSSFVTASQTLTTPQLAAITDATDLYLTFSASMWWLAGASIDLDFRDGLYYDSSKAPGTAVVTDYLSCTRASSAYAKTSAGALSSFATNTLRITDLGLLVEDARTNALTNSQSLDNSTYWAPDGVTVTADATAAPDGTTTADSLVETSTTSIHRVYYGTGATLTRGAPATLSFYVKANGRTSCAISLSDTVVGLCIGLDMSTPAIWVPTDSTSGWSNISYGFETLANGWFRIWLTGTTSNSGTLGIGQIAARNTTSGKYTDSYLGDVTKGIYVWGAQLEQAAFASSYIPTTTSATVTRARDLISITGNAATILGALPQSVVMDAQENVPASLSRSDNVSWIGDNAGGNGTLIAASTGAFFNVNSVFGSVAYPGNSLTSRAPGCKMAYCQDSVGASQVAGGGTLVNSTGSSLANTTPGLGCTPVGTSPENLNGYVRRLTLWNSRLADATLQALSYP